MLAFVAAHGVLRVLALSLIVRCDTAAGYTPVLDRLRLMAPTFGAGFVFRLRFLRVDKFSACMRPAA